VPAEALKGPHVASNSAAVAFVESCNALRGWSEVINKRL
jgi:hypothetical protein